MKSSLVFFSGVLLLSSASGILSQNTPSVQPNIAPLPDLTYTMPNGKVLTFGSLEQKEKFLAALTRTRVVAAAPAAPTPRPPIKSSLDAPSGNRGIGNPGAPIFTADYYLGGDPESWLGKKVTLAVAYLSPLNQADRTDGLRQLVAHTWNGAPGQAGEQSPGGQLTILASPSQAQKLLALCGTSLNMMSGNVRVMMIHGEFNRATVTSGEHAGSGRYCLYADR